MAVSSVKLIVDAANAINPLKRVAKETKKVEEGVRDVNGRLRDAKGRFIGAGKGAQQASGSFKSLAGNLLKVAAAYGTLAAAQSAVRAGIQRIESERRLQSLAKGYGEVAALSNAATQASQRFGVSQTTANKAIAQVYARLRPVGVTLEDIVSTYNGFNTAARISGSTAEEASNAFTQLAQALGSGALRGDEFNSISEQVPGILTAISKQTGIAQGNLRKFAAEGGITADIVIGALKRIEVEGADQLADALGGPAQAIRDFENATEEVQVALTQDVVPQLAESFRGLAELIVNLKGPIEFIGQVAANTLNQINSLIVASTSPGKVSARRDIKGGLLPLNVQGSAELFKGTGPQGKGLKGLQEESIELAKLRGQDRKTVLLELMKNRLGTMDAPPEMPTLPTPPIPIIKPKDGSGGAAKPDEAGKLLKQQLESGAKLSQQFTRQIELKEASSDLAREELQIEFDRQDALATIAETAEISQIAGLEELANKIAVLDIEEARGDLAAKQAKEQEKRDKAAADAAQKRLEADPLFQMQQKFEKLIDLENQVAAGATAIGNAFSNAFVGVISGAKSAQEGLAEMMQSVAKHFLDMAAKIIAQQIAMILYGTIMKALGVSMGGGGGMGGQNYFDPTTGLGVAGPNFGLAEGGYVTGPTNALIGEGGEPEYVIPESKMRESMGRYSRGSRGSSVIPAEGGGAAGSEGGTAVAAPIDVRYSVERINSVDYVTADQFQNGMKRAALEGAQRGQQLTLSRLQQSPATRRRIGM